MERKEGYRQRMFNQLEEWVKGNSVHNKVDDECCPDFSCCQPHLKQPKAIRETFFEIHKKKDIKGKEKLLFTFLGAALGGNNVYISGEGNIDAMQN